MTVFTTRSHRGRLTTSLIALFVSAILATSFLPLNAQETGSLRGTIEPAHDHEMVLATATLVGTGLEVSVDGDGSFEFPAVRPGSYVLRVHVPTLGTSVQRVEISSGEQAEVTIEVSPGSHFEEVVVSAPGDARDTLELASAVTTLSGSELLLRAEASLGETLSGEAGISSSFFGQGSSRPIIRGLSGDRVRMLESGIGTGDVSDVSVDHAVTSDPLQAERIEVLRGPATLLYGSSAVGGVVNVIDERIPTTRGSSKVSGTLDMRGGSVADERLGSIALKGGSGDWAWSLSAIARQTDDYEIPGHAELEGEEGQEEEHHDEEEGHDEEEEGDFGFVGNSDLDTRGGRFGVTRFFGDRGYLGVSVSGFDTEYGIPAGSHGHGHEEEGHDEEEGHHDDEEEGHHDEEDEGHDEEEEGEERVRVDMEQRRVDLRGLVNFDDGPFKALKLRVGANDYEHAELEGTEIGTLFFNDYVEGRIELVQRGNDRRSGSFGIQFSDRDLEAIGDEAFIPPNQTDRLAAFGFQELKTGDVAWQLGARFETQDSTALGMPDTSHDGVSGSLGLVWTLADSWALAGSLSRSVKLPAPEELFANGPHIATLAFEIGDPTLTEEVGMSAEVSLRRTSGRLTGELTFFQQQFDDFIFQDFTGEEEDGFPVVAFRQADADFEGAELTARLELLERSGHHLHLRVTGDTVTAELDRGGYLPRIPPMSFGTGLHYHSEQWNAMAEVRWVDDQNDVGQNETATEGYTLLNASLGYRFIVGEQILDILLRGRNLTDEEARMHTSFLKNLAPLPGRDIALSARLWF